MCKMAGWGKEGTMLIEAEVQVWDRKDCEKAFSKNKPFRRKFTKLLCAGKETTAVKV